jgi:hypothetical protein
MTKRKRRDSRGNERASKANLTEDADIIACPTQSLSSKQRHLKYTQLSNKLRIHYYQLWLLNFMHSNAVFTSQVLGQIFERQYFHISSHAQQASFILTFLFLASRILYCLSSLSSSLSSFYLDTFTICDPCHDVPNL